MLKALLVLVCISSLAYAELPAPFSNTEVEAASLKCTFCKYSVDFVCQTFLQFGSPTTAKLIDDIGKLLQKVCVGIGTPENGEQCCENLDTFKNTAGQTLFLISTILPNACNALDKACPENTPICYEEKEPEPEEPENPDKPDSFTLSKYATTTKKQNEHVVGIVIGELFKVSPAMSKFTTVEKLTQQVMDHQKTLF